MPNYALDNADIVREGIYRQRSGIQAAKIAFRSSVIGFAPMNVSSTFPWRNVSAAIVAVFATSALIGWLAWRAYRLAERLERDTRLLHRGLIVFGSLYLASSIWGIVQVIRGAAPMQSLTGLPISLFIAWVFFRAAT